MYPIADTMLGLSIRDSTGTLAESATFIVNAPRAYLHNFIRADHVMTLIPTATGVTCSTTSTSFSFGSTAAAGATSAGNSASSASTSPNFVASSP